MSLLELHRKINTEHRFNGTRYSDDRKLFATCVCGWDGEKRDSETLARVLHSIHASEEFSKAKREMLVTT